MLLPLVLLATAQTQPAQPATPATPSTPAIGSAQDHRQRLDGFSARLDELEGRIAVTGSRVELIRDAVLGEKIARSRAIIFHRNEMGSSFVLERATYLLDGGVIFSKEDATGGLDRQKEFEIFNGAINPGEHEITVAMVYGGSTYGFFTYLKGYKFKVESKYKFMVADGKLTSLSVVSFAKGDLTTQTSDRIAVRYDLEVGAVPAIEPAAAPAVPATETKK